MEILHHFIYHSRYVLHKGYCEGCGPITQKEEYENRWQELWNKTLKKRNTFLGDLGLQSSQNALQLTFSCRPSRESPDWLVQSDFVITCKINIWVSVEFLILDICPISANDDEQSSNVTGLNAWINFTGVSRCDYRSARRGNRQIFMHKSYEETMSNHLSSAVRIKCSEHT